MSFRLSTRSTSLRAPLARLTTTPVTRRHLSAYGYEQTKVLAFTNYGEPKDVLVTLGYAGWAAGQLEQELLDNAWLTVPADMAIVFDLPPEERLAAAMQKLGIDFANLSDVAGHA